VFDFFDVKFICFQILKIIPHHYTAKFKQLIK